MFATTNGKLGETRRKVPTSEISYDSLSAIRSPEFSHRSSPVGWSVGRSSWNFAAEKVVRGVCSIFLGNYLFPHPSPSIRMAEIKRQINVSRADGPNVRTENPILACRAIRLVRVSSLLLIASSPPFPVLLSILRPRVSPSPLSISPPSFYFLILLLLFLFILHLRIRTSIEIGP